MDSDEEVRKDAEDKVFWAKLAGDTARDAFIKDRAEPLIEGRRQKTDQAAKDAYDKTYQHFMVDAKIEARRKAQAAYDEVIINARAAARLEVMDDYKEEIQTAYDEAYQKHLDEELE